MFLLDNLGYKGFELMYFIILFARNNSIAKLIHNIPCSPVYTYILPVIPVKPVCETIFHKCVKSP